MDSMTKEELDGIKPLDDSRIKRISRGSGVHVAEIHFLLAEHKKFGGMVKNLGGMAGMMGGMGGANMENVSEHTNIKVFNLIFTRFTAEKKPSRGLEDDEELAE